MRYARQIQPAQKTSTMHAQKKKKKARGDGAQKP